MSVFSRLHLFPGFAVFCLALLHAAGAAPAEGRFAKGPLAPILAGHDYDPISDAVVSWTLKAGESVGQSFTMPANGGELRRFRLKLLRVGTAPPLRYRIGTAWAKQDVASGEIAAESVFLNPEYKPVHGLGRQFKNDLSWTRPWGPELALRQLEQLEAGWQLGVKSWAEVISKAAPQLRANAEREAGVGRAILHCIRSTVHVGRFYQVRDTLWQEKESGRAAKLWDQLRDIAQAELVNARDALRVVSRDSRLGYANSGGSNQTGVPRGGIYSPGSIEKKIEQVKRLLEKEIPEYQRRLGHPTGR
jgi:hypothetical protein